MKLEAVQLAECTGCRVCELVCALRNFDENNPAKAALRVRGQFPAPGHYSLRLCNQCGECATYCPIGAIYQREDGVYLIDETACNGCLGCVGACPDEALFWHESLEAPIKCTSCGECVTFCPKQVLAMQAAGVN